MNNNCPCASGKKFNVCCEPYLMGEKLPPTPEALMRSRYTAFTLCSIDYLNKTMTMDKIEQLSNIQWLGLNVIDAKDNFVEFIAYNNRGVLHEISEFRQINGQWFYVGGVIKK